MKKNNLTKTIATLALASALGGGSVAIDNATVTDSEIKASIELATTQGKIPEIDLAKVSLDRMAKGYLAVAVDHNVPLNGKNGNVYELIRNKKKKEGKKVLATSTDLLLVK